MSFKNTSSYVQRKIDNILRIFKNFCRTYINDIVIFNKTLKKHVKHLHLIFKLFTNLNINLSSTKFFLDYLTIQFLKLKIDVFDLSTSKEKLKTIFDFKFSKIFQDLKTYLKFTKWLRNYIFFFAQKSEFLQARKIALFRLSFNNKDRLRKTFAHDTIVDNATQAELNVYEQIQESFSRNSFLFHFDHIKSLYINIDASKRWKFDVMIYHDKNNIEYSSDKYSKKTDVQLILFLSRLFIDSEKRYWSIELKMIELVWVVKRIRHMIESAKKITLIFIDYIANFSIAKQTTLNSENIDKFNLRLIKISAYFSQFNIDIKYKSKKVNIVSNALSKFSSISSFRNDANMNTLNIDSYHCVIQDIAVIIHVFQKSLIAIISDFRAKLSNNYFKNKIWSKIVKSLQELQARLAVENMKRKNQNEINSSSDSKERIRTEIDFEMHNDFIYYKKNRRLCISKSIEKKIFNLTHDNNQHSDAIKCFYRIKEFLFISRLFKKLKTYIDHCSQCQLNQTKRHKIYEKLMSISISAISFYTVAMNFIMTISNDLDTLLTVTC